MSQLGSLTTVTAVAHDARAWLDRLWSSIADRGQPYAAVPEASVPPLERARQLASSLLSERGEASGAAIARELQSSARALSPEDRVAFLDHLAEGARVGDGGVPRSGVRRVEVQRTGGHSDHARLRGDPRRRRGRHRP